MPARQNLVEVLTEDAFETPIQMIAVASEADAELLGMRGSPMIRIDGVDIDPDWDGPIGLALARLRRRRRPGQATDPARGRARARLGPRSPRLMLAAALRAFFLWLSNRRWMARVALGTPLLRRMPLRFVAGTTLDQAIAAVRGLNAAGASATLDVLGESVGDRASADRAAASYVEAIERIAAEELDANVSIKLSQMGLDLGVEECLAVMAPVVAAGDRHGIFVRIDMESSDYTDRTLEVVDRLRAGGHDVGPVIQSYLHRSPADVERLAAERVRTRICKGAYAEGPEVAHQERVAVGDAFVTLCEELLRADAYPGVATHDPEMLERVAIVRAAARHRAGPVRVPDAVRRAPRPPAAADREGISAADLRAVWDRVVSVLHATPGRAAGQRPVRAAQHPRGAFLKGRRRRG